MSSEKRLIALNIFESEVPPLKSSLPSTALFEKCRWRWKKGPKQRWSGYFSLCPFPSWKGVFSQNGPQRSRARRCCAAKRTLHGEDRSEILDKRERGGIIPRDLLHQLQFLFREEPATETHREKNTASFSHRAIRNK